MGSWERYVARFLHAFRLDSIKRKILVFALLATLVPSLTTTWLSYIHNRRSLTEKITAELRNISRHSTRVTDLWLDERFREIETFSTSFVVREDLDRVIRAQQRGGVNTEATRRLQDYVTSVLERSLDIELLTIVDPRGGIAASTGAPEGFELPEDWLNQITDRRRIQGSVYRDESLDHVVMMIAVPIEVGDRFLGAIAAKISFRTIDGAMRAVTLGESGHVYVIREDGTVMVSSRIVPTALTNIRLAAPTVARLVSLQGGGAFEYTDPQGNEVVGTLDRVPDTDWAVVAEVMTEEAFVQITELRNQTFLLVSTLLLSVGLIAYVLVLLIVRPLDRLTAGAARVAGGDLEVDLPVVTRGELGYMTEVFNAMVTRLRNGREELERLSVTDGLTGLFNREHLMVTLTMEIARADRQEEPFSALMIDLDHFKKYNDTYGHLAGDEILAAIGGIFADCIREVDYAARYGGEEFLVMLPQTGLSGAAEVAERIRTRFEEDTKSDNKDVALTLSIGVAEYPKHGDTAESIVAAADAALYQAKRRGRNRVVRATAQQGKSTPRARGKQARGRKTS